MHQIVHQRKVSNILIKIIQLYMNMETIFFLHSLLDIVFSFLNPTFSVGTHDNYEEKVHTYKKVDQKSSS